MSPQRLTRTHHRARIRRWFRREVERPLRKAVGGPARLRVIVLLACVLGLDAADTATVGAVAEQLERAFGVGNTAIGLLVTVSTGIGALATLPVGILVDRVHRIRLLVIAIVIWCVAMAVSAVSGSYEMLLGTRLALGAVVATASPAVASLTGDLFPAAERGRIYGYILSGELIGAAIGFLACGDIAAVATWRAGFLVLVPPGLVLAWALHRMLPEPARGGAGQLRIGQRNLPTADQAETRQPDHDNSSDADSPGAGSDGDSKAAREVTGERIEPRRHLVLSADPSRQSLAWAVRYVLSIRTNRVLIIASALGYFYFTGIRTFAVIYLRDRFGLGQAAGSTLLVAIGIGALVGVLVAGRAADRLLHTHHLAARPIVAGLCFLTCAALFVIGLFVGGLPVAVLLFFLGAAGLGGANPPLDAARLDIMHSRLWGRAESVRTVLRSGLVAVAPLLFGLISAAFGGQGGYGYRTGGQPHGAAALGQTFLILIVTLLVAGVLLVVVARRTYPGDVATAVASEQATSADADRRA